MLKSECTIERSHIKADFHQPWVEIDLYPCVKDNESVLQPYKRLLERKCFQSFVQM